MPSASEQPIKPYPRQPVEYQAYDPRFPVVAQHVIDLIQAQLPNVTVEHIGSTAVPGCAGRGAIDLMVLYANEPVEPIVEKLEALGFQWVQRLNVLPDDWPKGAGTIHYQGQLYRLHIHVQPADHPTVQEKRSFRDRLRSEPALLAAYLSRKQAILASGITNPIEYTAAKADFISQALEA